MRARKQDSDKINFELPASSVLPDAADQKFTWLCARIVKTKMRKYSSSLKLQEISKALRAGYALAGRLPSAYNCRKGCLIEVRT